MISEWIRSAPCPRCPKTKYESARGQRYGNYWSGNLLRLAGAVWRRWRRTPVRASWTYAVAGVKRGATTYGEERPSLHAARARRAPRGCERVRLEKADAEVFPSEPASFDAAFSRLGVMFFAAPAAAFINIRRSLRPNWRLAFVCLR